MKDSHREDRSWPGYLFGGRLRTSTAALLIVSSGSGGCMTPTSLSPAAAAGAGQRCGSAGFIPDPSYTWVPRTDAAAYGHHDPDHHTDDLHVVGDHYAEQQHQWGAVRDFDDGPDHQRRIVRGDHRAAPSTAATAGSAAPSASSAAPTP